MSTTYAEFLNSYERIKKANETALKAVKEASELETQEKPLEAIGAYEQSLKLIDELFDIPVGLPDDINDIETEWNEACSIIQMLKDTKSDVTDKLITLKAQHNPLDVNPEDKPESDTGNNSKNEDSNNEIIDPTTRFKDTAKSLREIMADKNIPVVLETLFQAQVKLYKIKPNGEVQKKAGESTMSLVMCTVGDNWSHINGSYFLQCTMKEQLQSEKDQTSTTQTDNMVWIYPLIPNVTTCYRSEYEAFIFPDLEDNIAGSAFGIMLNRQAELTEEQYADMQQCFMDLLESLLTNRIEKLPRQPLDTSQKVAKNMITAADFIARNLVKGAEKTGDLMKQSTPYIISKMKPATENTKPPSKGVQTTVEMAKGVTTAAADFTGWVVHKVDVASEAVGKFLAPHFQHQGNNLLQKTCGIDEKAASSKMDGALNVAKGAVDAISSIFHGLYKSAAILGTNIKNNSVQIIEYKYGPSAGYVTADTFDAFGNVFTVSHNVHHMMPTHMLGKTSFTVIREYNPNENLKK